MANRGIFHSGRDQQRDRRWAIYSERIHETQGNPHFANNDENSRFNIPRPLALEGKNRQKMAETRPKRPGIFICLIRWTCVFVPVMFGIETLGTQGFRQNKKDKKMTTTKRTMAVMVTKPADIKGMMRDLHNSREPVQEVIITDTIEMTQDEFTEFTENLTKPRQWLVGKGGLDAASGLIKAIQIVPPAGYQASLMVNPEGYDYARYVGIEIKK
ncbi:MAG: hypothetical protein LBL18_01435 [Bacteroidales bacterium]|jgi:hypothetical protein|nr:hypothetical protein [Bacteroidales bacterium]